MDHFSASGNFTATIISGDATFVLSLRFDPNEVYLCNKNLNDAQVQIHRLKWLNFNVHFWVH